jgi:hypothetical protein
MALRSARHAFQGRRPPLDRFVDRIGPLTLLERAVQTIKPEESSLVCFHGAGGQGKSLFVRKFIEHLENRRYFHDVAWSLIDLSERTDRDSWHLLVWVRNDLAERGIRFPAFDLGFELYWAEAFPETPPPLLRHRWLKRLTDASASGGGDVATTIAAERLAAHCRVSSICGFGGKSSG